MFIKKGFTLIEIMIVIGILGAVLALSAPVTSRFSGVLFLNAAAKALASDLRGLQHQAILRHQTRRFVPAEFDLPPGIRFMSAAGITFSPSGNPPPGGSGSLILQNSLGSTRKVVVSSAGRVRVE